MSPVALLDVNLLVSLFDPDHIHHEIAHDWFADNREAGWATCPTTEAGFLRVLGNPAYGPQAARVPTLARHLEKFRGSGHHRFWAEPVSLLDRTLFDLTHAGGHRQLTDVYLLGLATRMRGRLATFDRTIPLKAVVGARPATLAIIGPAAD